MDRSGNDIHKNTPLPSSFWIRFREEVCVISSHGDPAMLTVIQWFQLRAFCSGEEDLAFAPYECVIPFRDITTNGIRVHAQYPLGPEEHQKRVLVQLFVRSRRPARYAHYLQPALQVGREARHATEADFFDPPVAERLAGQIEAVWDARSRINVSVRRFGQGFIANHVA